MLQLGFIIAQVQIYGESSALYKGLIGALTAGFFALISYLFKLSKTKTKPKEPKNNEKKEEPKKKSKLAQQELHIDKICPKCGAKHPDTRKFCPDCDKKLKIAPANKCCPKCNKVFEPTRKTCPNCDVKLKAICRPKKNLFIQWIEAHKKAVNISLISIIVAICVLLSTLFTIYYFNNTQPCHAQLCNNRTEKSHIYCSKHRCIDTSCDKQKYLEYDYCKYHLVSADIDKDTKYNICKELYNNKEYSLAQQGFNTICGYKDSSSFVVLCSYNQSTIGEIYENRSKYNILTDEMKKDNTYFEKLNKIQGLWYVLTPANDSTVEKIRASVDALNIDIKDGKYRIFNIYNESNECYLYFTSDILDHFTVLGDDLKVDLSFKGVNQTLYYSHSPH